MATIPQLRLKEGDPAPEFTAPGSGGGTVSLLDFKGKNVVLGLVSSKLPQLESQDELVGKIEEAGKFMPLQNLALSPQCGFASTMEGNLLTEDQQWRKLDLVAKTARQVWQDA